MREGGRQCENVDDTDLVLEIHELPARAAEERDANRLLWLSVTCRGSSVEGASSAGRVHGAGEDEDGRLQPTSRGRLHGRSASPGAGGGGAAGGAHQRGRRQGAWGAVGALRAEDGDPTRAATCGAAQKEGGLCRVQILK